MDPLPPMARLCLIMLYEMQEARCTLYRTTCCHLLKGSNLLLAANINSFSINSFFLENVKEMVVNYFDDRSIPKKQVLHL